MKLEWPTGLIPAALALSACGGAVPRTLPPPVENPGPRPTATAAPKTRTFLYELSTTPRQITVNEIDEETGALLVREIRTVEDGDTKIGAHADGKFLFESHKEGVPGPDRTPWTVKTYAVGVDGTLQDLRTGGRTQEFGGPNVGAIGGPGRTLYTRLQVDHQVGIVGWNLDTATGVLDYRGWVASGFGLNEGGTGWVEPFVVGPMHSHVYSLEQWNKLLAFSIRGDGGLDPATHQPLPNDTSSSLAVEPSGQHLYVAGWNADPPLFTPRAGHFSVFSLDDPNAPRLQQNLPSLSTAPMRLVFDPTGRFLFAGTSNGPSTPTGTGIAVYEVDNPDGHLAPREWFPIGDLADFYVTPQGRFLYARREDGTLWGYTVDRESGGLQDLGKLDSGIDQVVIVERTAAE